MSIFLCLENKVAFISPTPVGGFFLAEAFGDCFDYIAQKPNFLLGIFTLLIKFQYFCSCVENKNIRNLIVLCLLVMGLCILEYVNYLKFLEICCLPLYKIKKSCIIYIVAAVAL